MLTGDHILIQTKTKCENTNLIKCSHQVEKTKSLDRLVQPPPAEVDVWRGAEVVAYGEDNMRLWEETIEADPRDSYAHRRLGRAYEVNGQRTQAMEHYQAAIKIDPDYNYAKRDLGVAMAAEAYHTCSSHLTLLSMPYPP